MSNLLRAGAAKFDITPPDDFYPCFNKPNGSGGPDSYFIRAHEHIYLRCMIIENDNKRVVILSWDTGGLDSVDDDGRKYTQLAADIAGVDFDDVLVAPTHNHNCFDMHYAEMKKGDAELYAKFVKYDSFIYNEAVPTVVKEALGKIQPCKIGFGKSQCYMNVSRHGHAANGEPTIYDFSPERPSDRDCIVLDVKTLDDKPIGVLYNYAAHGSLLANNKPDGENTELSGDWPGVTSRKLEEYMGNDAVALFMIGAAGDQNAVMIARVYDVLADNTAVLHDFGSVGYIVLDFMAGMVFRSVLEAIANIKSYKTGTRISCKKRSCEVTRDYFDFEGNHNSYLPESHPRYKAPVFDFTLLMLGDIALAATNGEIYTSIGMRFKETAPYRKTMFITMAGRSLAYVKDDTGSGKVENLIKENLYDMMEKYSDEE